MSEQEKPCEWTALPFTETDKQWMEQQEYICRKVIEAFGIPPSLLGLIPEGNYSKRFYSWHGTLMSAE